MRLSASLQTAQPAGMRAYGLLRLDLLSLLVPQAEVRALEPASDLQFDALPPNGVGWIRFEHQRFPVYCFTERLHRTPDVPPSRRICAVLGADDATFGMLCSDVSLVRLADEGPRSLPEAMVLPGRPIHGLALHDGAVLCLSSAARLIAHARAAALE